MAERVTNATESDAIDISVPTDPDTSAPTCVPSARSAA